jgi:DNA-binding ferritin-like protein (Dps family)
MNFWETITGSDLTREWKAFEARAEALPADYRAAWEEIKGHLSAYSDFTGRNLMPILDGALGLLEDVAGAHGAGQGAPAGLPDRLQGDSEVHLQGWTDRLA